MHQRPVQKHDTVFFKRCLELDMAWFGETRCEVIRNVLLAFNFFENEDVEIDVLKLSVLSLYLAY